jgi:hypothetical protein
VRRLGQEHITTHFSNSSVGKRLEDRHTILLVNYNI